MDKFEQKEIKKKIPIKNIMYGLLTNYIPKSIGKTVSAFKNKVVSLFKTNTPENYRKQSIHGSRK